MGKKLTTLAAIFVYGGGLISLIYLLNLGFGVVELSPDNIPITGHIDEAVACVFLFNAMKAAGFDIVGLLPSGR